MRIDDGAEQKHIVEILLFRMREFAANLVAARGTEFVHHGYGGSVSGEIGLHELVESSEKSFERLIGTVFPTGLHRLKEMLGIGIEEREGHLNPQGLF